MESPGCVASIVQGPAPTAVNTAGDVEGATVQVDVVSEVRVTASAVGLLLGLALTLEVAVIAGVSP